MNWFQIFNLTEWLDEGLVSRTLTVFLEGIGQTEILITHGNETSIHFSDVFLPIGFEGLNPWVEGDYGVFLDEDNNVWLGVAA